jgi:predicted nucleic acid-binding protein
MQYLLDTGILLRLLNRNAHQHAETRAAVRLLKQRRHECLTSLQNLCEFWNVCTRPASARGGLGLSVAATQRRIDAIERLTTILPDSSDTFRHWKTLVVTHGVSGVQAHDARLVALMEVHNITSILTLNPSDFARYPKLQVSTPQMILQT